MPSGAVSLKIQFENVQVNLVCFFFVASKFNSEMQAMEFCGRILPSLYTVFFLVVAIFC